MTDYAALIRALTENQVKFIIVGGAAATVHGSARFTEDLDIVYHRTKENVRRLIAALSSFQPYLRGAPLNLPFEWNEQTIWNGLNFTLSTSIGPIDVLGELVGGGTYVDLASDCILIDIFGSQCLCLSLKRLIQTKRAAGRPKDLEAIAELERILEEQETPSE